MIEQDVMFHAVMSKNIHILGQQTRYAHIDQSQSAHALGLCSVTLLLSANINVGCAGFLQQILHMAPHLTIAGFACLSSLK